MNEGEKKKIIGNAWRGMVEAKHYINTKLSWLADHFARFARPVLSHY